MTLMHVAVDWALLNFQVHNMFKVGTLQTVHNEAGLPQLYELQNRFTAFFANSVFYNIELNLHWKMMWRVTQFTREWF